MSVKKYQPSNGTEGDMFISQYCSQCKHERFIHSQQDGDKTCDILTRTMCHSVNEPEYPEEWQYNEEGKGYCTKYDYKQWWDGEELLEAEEEIFIDPNQLSLFGEWESL